MGNQPVEWNYGQQYEHLYSIGGYIVPNELLHKRALKLAAELSPEGAYISIGGIRGLEEPSRDNCRQKYILIDRYAPVVALPIMLLEVGARLREDFGSLDVETYVDYLLRPDLTKTDYVRGLVEQQGKAFESQLTIALNQCSEPNSPTTFHKYLLEYDLKNIDPGVGWLASDRGLNNVIDKYINGQIEFHVGDITDTSLMTYIGNRLRESRCSVGVVDLSNINQYMFPIGRQHLEGIIGVTDSTATLPMTADASIHLTRLQTGKERVYTDGLTSTFSHHVIQLAAAQWATKAINFNPITSEDIFNTFYAMRQPQIQVRPVDELGIYMHSICLQYAS